MSIEGVKPGSLRSRSKHFTVTFVKATIKSMFLYDNYRHSFLYSVLIANSNCTLALNELFILFYCMKCKERNLCRKCIT
jgi:hypothetical protein